MDGHTIVTTLIGILCTVIGFIVKSLWDRIDTMEAMDTKLADKVNSIEVLVAGKYVMKDELERYMDAIFKKLDRIVDKLDTKEDRNIHNIRTRAGDKDEI